MPESFEPTVEQTNAATAKLLEIIETVVDMTLRYGEFTTDKIRTETWPIYAANSILRAAVEAEDAEAERIRALRGDPMVPLPLPDSLRDSILGLDGRGQGTGTGNGSQRDAE